MVRALKRNLVYIVLLSAFTVLLLIDTAACNIRINFADVPLDAKMSPDVKVCLDTYGGDAFLSSEHAIINPTSTGMIQTSHWTRPNCDMKFIFEGNRGDETGIQIDSLIFRFLFFPIYRIDAGNYSSALTSESPMAVAENGGIDIGYIEKRAVVSCRSDDLIQAGVLPKIKGIKYGLAAFMLAVMLLFVLLDVKVPEPRKADHIKWIVVLGTVLCLTFCMSFFGTEYANPDEDVSAGSVQYYYTHWGLPKFDSEDAVATFCNYGTSRINEKTVYYFLAGKVGKVFGSVFRNRPAYRAFNWLLLLMLACIYAVKGKGKKWLLFGIVLTPQLWYLFSYATSDAWDYFVCFLLILSLGTLGNPNKRLSSLARGLLLGLILIGKYNYYIVVLFAGLYYVYAFVSQRSDRKALMKDFAITASVCLAVYACRVGMDYLHYGPNKADLVNTVGRQFQTVFVVSIRTIGRPLSYVITKTNLFDRLSKSFAGIYGWMRFESGAIYYFCIFSCYALLLAFYSVHGYRSGKVNLKLGVTSAYLVIFVACMMVVYHCWTSDFQAQGRYLLSMIPCLMGLISKDEKRFETQAAEYLMEAIALLSIGSFVLYGMSNIV